MLVRGPRLLLLGMVATLVVGVAAPAAALDVNATSPERVLGDIHQQRLQVRLDDGEVARGNVLSFPETSSDVELRPRLARDTIAGLQRFDELAAQEVGRGAVAGTNGGYFLRRPWGAPNGLHVRDGRLVSGDSVGLRGNHSPRGMVGIQQAGRLVMDRLRTQLFLDAPAVHGTRTFEVDEINRQVRTEDDETSAVDGELLLYDDRYGAPVELPPAAIALELDGLRVATSGRTSGTVAARTETTEDTALRVPDGSHLLVAYGSRLTELFELRPGHEVGVTTSITPYETPAGSWEDLRGGLAGGQLLILEGRVRTLAEWRTQNFGDSHITGRHPRTAIARTSDDRVLLVTVDGRQSGWSVGMTLRELSETLLALDVVDAVNLDGGGASTLTIDGRIQNRPSETGRSVADGLFLYVEPPPAARGLAAACPDGAPSAGFDDVPGTTHAAAIDCLAWWRVTTGVTPSVYAPAREVSRAQMASFLARWIDDLADRGGGEPLPASPPLTFADVDDDGAHADAIARLADAGILRGRSESHFEPWTPVSRAQTATLVRQAVEYATSTSVPARADTFVDDNGSVHEANVDRLAGVGVITGTGGYSFRPSVPVSRGAMASLLMRASDLLVADHGASPPS